MKVAGDFLLGISAGALFKEMTMAMNQQSTVVGVFENRENAERAVSELRAAGFENDRIGVVGRESGDGSTSSDAEQRGENGMAGAATGAAIGAGAGGLVALGILSGFIPGIGPAIAAGTLGMVLSNVGLGAAAIGIAGTLVGIGMPQDEAEHYESEFQAGRTIVTVQDATGKAWQILQRNGGYNRQNATAQTSGTLRDSARSNSPTSY